MKFQPYPFQRAAIDHACEFFRTADLTARQLYAAPTGCGKSVIQLMTQAEFSDLWIVTPREEIAAGMLDKLGDPDGDMLDHRICTPIRLRNKLLRGGSGIRPGKLIFDEGHHHSAESWQQLDLLTGLAPSAAYTATPYRGSPKSTRDFRERWGETLWIITYEEAAADGYISVPDFQVLPLVDDDIIDIQGGEFDVTSIDGATVDRLGDLADHAKQWYRGGLWDRPTIFALPSSACCARLQQELSSRGLPSMVVSAKVAKSSREPAFLAARNRVLALLHINVITEGVDLPLRRLVDVAPTMSPVKWVQQLGRITRPVAPGEAPPEYICTNRNIVRHAYALDGVVPVSAAADSEKAFGPTQRAHARALGLEAIGRFKPAPTKLLSGCTLYTYSLHVVVGTVAVEYCCLVHPTKEALWASKVNVVKDGTKTWGSWQRCEPPNDMRGFASHSTREPTEKQLRWWNRCAASYGLDPEQDVTKRSFQALPVLSDLDVHDMR